MRPPRLTPHHTRAGNPPSRARLQEAQIVIGFPAPSHADQSFVAAHLFSSILGGGMASRLFQELRENRGLCYSVHSFYWPFSDAGVFGINAATSEDDIGELMPVIVEELRKMADGVTDAELRRAKAQLPLRAADGSGKPDRAREPDGAAHPVHGRPLSLAEMVAKVDAVTQADLAALGEGLLDSYPTLAAIGPIDPLPGIGDFASDIAGRKAAVGC